MRPLINILIRNKYRPELFRRCVESIASQTYKDYRIIVACECPEGFRQAYDLLGKDIFLVETWKTKSHYWNLYCNELKSRVDDGYFIFVDNDDYLASPTVLEELSEHLTGDGVICQFLRNGKPKPNDHLIKQRKIIKGRIGGGCLVLHHKFKSLVDWDNQAAADYRWISGVAEIADLKFISLIVQITDQKNNGK